MPHSQRRRPTGPGRRQVNGSGLSVFVVVAFVGDVPVSVVHVVQVVAVQDGGVAASLTVYVNVLLSELMDRCGALVVVVVMAAVDVLVVQVIDVTVVTYPDMSAVLAVFVVVRFGRRVAMDGALVVVPVVRVVQVPVVEVVDVAHVFKRAMPAVRPVNVDVLLPVDRVRGFGCHVRSSPR